MYVLKFVKNKNKNGDDKILRKQTILFVGNIMI